MLSTQENLSDTAFRVRENLARRILKRRWGFNLIKSRRRDQEAPDFGLYAIIDSELRMYVAGGTPWAYSLTFDEVMAWIEEVEKPTPPASKPKAKRSKRGRQ